MTPSSLVAAVVGVVGVAEVVVAAEVAASPVGQAPHRVEATELRVLRRRGHRKDHGKQVTRQNPEASWPSAEKRVLRCTRTMKTHRYLYLASLHLYLAM